MIATGMILAAGFGTRLRPLTHELPKPLVPIGDRSVLAHAADKPTRDGGDPRRHQTPITWRKRYDEASLAESLAMHVSLNREERILGTAGGIQGAAARLGDGPVVIHNGDILADLDTRAPPVPPHAEREPLATLALVGEQPPGAGPVGLDGRTAASCACVTSISAARRRRGAQFIGVHIVSAALRERLPEEGCMVGDVYIPALRAGEPIAGVKVVRRFTDVGTPRSYLDANLRWLGDRPHHVGPGASVSPEIELSASVVGAGATIGGRGQVERCVIWPGAQASAPLRDAIVTTGGKSSARNLRPAQSDMLRPQACVVSRLSSGCSCWEPWPSIATATPSASMRAKPSRNTAATWRWAAAPSRRPAM